MVQRAAYGLQQCIHRQLIRIVLSQSVLLLQRMGRARCNQGHSWLGMLLRVILLVRRSMHGV